MSSESRPTKKHTGLRVRMECCCGTDLCDEEYTGRITAIMTGYGCMAMNCDPDGEQQFFNRDRCRILAVLPPIDAPA